MTIPSFSCTKDEIQSLVKKNSSAGWWILNCDGFVFKIHNLWIQVVQSPAGWRASGVSGNKTQKALVSEINNFLSK